MVRTDIHLDAMLRHLGAAYYESLHGRASRTDVTRALDTVEEHLKEQRQRRGGATSPAGVRPPRQPAAHPAGRWTRRVRDVMTTSVVTVDRITPYKEIARLMTEHRISGMPVLMMGRHVAGVVSEADLLVIEDSGQRRARMGRGGARLRWRGRRRPHWGLTAGELMTAPPVTIHPDATIPGAARVMNAHHIRRLPVVDPGGRLLGIVSRRDLLTVFLRPDPEIARDVTELLDDLLHEDPGGVTAAVRNGVVTLTGSPPTGGDQDLIPVLIRLVWDVDGVVDVLDRLGEKALNPAEAEEARLLTHEAAQEQWAGPDGDRRPLPAEGTGPATGPSGDGPSTPGKA